MQANTIPAASVLKDNSIPSTMVQSFETYTLPAATPGAMENTTAAIETEAAIVIASLRLGFIRFPKSSISSAANKAVPTARAGFIVITVMTALLP